MKPVRKLKVAIITKVPLQNIFIRTEPMKFISTEVFYFQKVILVTLKFLIDRGGKNKWGKVWKSEKYLIYEGVVISGGCQNPKSNRMKLLKNRR